MTRPSSILVDVELPDPAPLSPALVDLLASLRVVLVGWYAVPEQTSPAQARDQFKNKAQAALDSIAFSFEQAGAVVDTHLVFTGDKLDTVSRVSTEQDCDAVLIPAAMERLERLLVPLRGLHNAQRIAPLVADLVRDSTASQDGTTVTLLHILEPDETETAARQDVLQPAGEIMTDAGIQSGLLELKTTTAGDPAATVVEMSADYDLVVLGETEPSVREILFGSIPEQIVNEARVPVVVVRHEEEGVEAAERATQAE
jgi:nucleotide-binding universal stress UspA family protein